jgi:hypothetical protein
MRKKPLFLTLLSVLCLIEPLIKVLYFKLTTNFSFITIMSNLSARDSLREVFEFWLLFPIAGLMIIKLRNWSYVGFIALMGYTISTILNYEEYTWPYNSDTPFVYSYLVAAFCFCTIVYFLLPNTRRPFFDARVRWWEPMVRFQVSMKCHLINARGNWTSTIRNVSKSGVFIEGGQDLEVGDKLIMEFTAYGETHSLIIEVMNKHTMDNRHGFGARFHFDSISQVFKLRSVINKIEASQESGAKSALAA